jgi:hypothetical protein
MKKIVLYTAITVILGTMFLLTPGNKNAYGYYWDSYDVPVGNTYTKTILTPFTVLDEGPNKPVKEFLILLLLSIVVIIFLKKKDLLLLIVVVYGFLSIYVLLNMVPG